MELGDFFGIFENSRIFFGFFLIPSIFGIVLVFLRSFLTSINTKHLGIWVFVCTFIVVFEIILIYEIFGIFEMFGNFLGFQIFRDFFFFFLIF